MITRFRAYLFKYYVALKIIFRFIIITLILYKYNDNQFFQFKIQRNT